MNPQIQIKRGPFRPTPVISLDDVPGYKEAVAKERKNRVLSFFEVSQTICGFEVMPLTLRRRAALKLCDSAFLKLAIPSPDELALFLWAMSPHYGRRPVWLERIAKRRLLSKCRRTFAPSLKKPRWMSEKRWIKREALKFANAEQMIRTIYEMITQVFQDAARGGGSDGKSYYEGIISLIGYIARHYGWSERDIMDIPLSRLFQYVKECREQDVFTIALQTLTEYQCPLSNPSDEVTARFCIEEGKRQIQRN